MKGKPLTQAEVEKLFSDANCTLLGKFEKTVLPIEFICSCGKQSKVSVGYFKIRLKQRNGMFCAHEKKPKLTHEEVKNFFTNLGYVLLTKEYTGINQKLTYRCSCGRNERTATFDDFRYHQGLQCKQCVREIKSQKGKAAMSDPKVLEKRKQTWMQKYGTESPFQNSAVKEQRRQTIRDRYGVDEVSQSPEIRKRQREGFLKKYGVSHFMKVPELLQKYQATLLERYGAPSLAFVSRRSSIEAQKFFSLVFQSLPTELQEKCYFSPHSREFNVWYNQEYFKYDFVQSAVKRCVEYNGSRFHPKVTQQDDEVGWCLFRPKLTVGEARAHENHKLGALLERGFQVLVVWDYEVKQDPDLVIRRCLDFLMGLTPGNWSNPTASSPAPSSPS